MGRFENRGVVNRGVMRGAVVHRAVEKRCGVRCFVNGTAFDTDLGQVTALPSGHDAWVVGAEPVIVVDCSSAGKYAKAWWSRQVEHQLSIGAPDCSASCP
jgi:hypothetical protein